MNTFRISACAAVIAGLAGTATAAHAAEYANVVSAIPVMASVDTPRQECVDVPQVVRQQPSGGGALIGALVGGVVGNQFGHGFGRAAATGLGAVAGSAIGNNIEASNGAEATVASRRCRTVGGYDNRVVGYDVVYDYNGQRYQTRLPRDPGPRLAIDVRPAAAPLDRIGAPATYGAVPLVYDDAPTYADAPAYADAPRTYYEQAPTAYYAPAPAPVYYGPGAYVGPALIGAGLGFWVGNSWHRGYRGGYHGRRGHWR
ncbi:MAG: glycine zipper 2TM domain-containing protein [Caldimonas sp.]